MIEEKLYIIDAKTINLHEAAEAVAKTMNAIVDEEYDLPILKKKYADFILSLSFNNNLFLAKDEEFGFCGMVYFTIYPDIISQTDITRIHHIHVKSDSQRSGIGTGILKHLKSYPVSKIELETSTVNDKAKSFYIKNGFTNNDNLSIFNCLKS